MNLRQLKTIEQRRKALARERGVSLEHIGSYSLDDAVASARNCENMIGVAQIPLGIAGPLKVQSSKFKVQSYYVPLATTEAALIASVNRGCKAITASGGAIADSYSVGATRGAVFHVSGLTENDTLNTFLEEHFKELQAVAGQTSKHLTLTQLFSRGLGRNRYVRFIYDTQDAMGMNMATVATTAVVRTIEAQTGTRCISVAGNYDTDKKPSWLNVIEGRGRKVWAEVTIPATMLRDILKTTAQEMYDVWIAKCMIGSAMAGSMGFNAHYANVLAALFLATGQDPAHVGEASAGITTCEVVKIDNSKLKIENYGLYVSVYLPDLMVGTVGGGTGLATQKEALSLLQVAGGKRGENAQKFAEIAGATVLAGEISLLASLAEGSLARAHQRLARSKP
jgi:hydroxymethylglutaryl-CoA reductase (NADPH)